MAFIGKSLTAVCDDPPLWRPPRNQPGKAKTSQHSGKHRWSNESARRRSPDLAAAADRRPPAASGNCRFPVASHDPIGDHAALGTGLSLRHSRFPSSHSAVHNGVRPQPCPFASNQGTFSMRCEMCDVKIPKPLRCELTKTLASPKTVRFRGLRAHASPFTAELGFRKSVSLWLLGLVSRLVRRVSTFPSQAIRLALNMTVCGIIAHQSALKGGELMKIPQFA